MTQSKISPSEGSSQLRDAYRYALITAGLMALATIAMLFFFGMPANLYDATYWAALVCLVALFSAWLIKRGRLDLSIGLLIGAIQVGILISSIKTSDLGVAFAAVGLTTTFSLSHLMGSRRLAMFANIASIATAILLLAFDFFKPFERVSNGNATATWIIAGGVILVYAIIILRQSWGNITNSIRTSIRNQLAGVTILMALVPVLIVSIFIGVLATSQSRAALQADALAQLESVRTIKSAQLTAYYFERGGDAKVTSQNRQTLDALTSLTDGFSAVGASAVRALYLGKPDLPDAGDSSTYTAAHRQFSTYLSNVVSAYSYYDVFLINRNGQVVYTYAKEDDFGTNLVSGKYADTNLAKVFQAALKLKQGETTVSDFQFYAPSANAPAAFTAAPIYVSGQLVGVLAFQLPLDKITAIMQERTGLGETGETYLVGGDHLFRSESRFTKDTLLTQKVDTEAVQNALAGKTGFGLITDYRGTPVFSAWQPVKIGDLQWAFIAEIDQSEALASANQLTTSVAAAGSVAGFIVIVLALVVAFLVSRSFVQPILELKDGATSVASGKLDTVIASDREDELGVLASAFNSMTSQLRDLINSLEQRVAARTKDLATVAEVGTAIATILETNRLLQEVVDLTKERFNLYHSHIYLLDQVGENLVLASGAGEPGRQMVAEKRSIPLDREQSLVARAARERRGVTVNDVTQAPDFLPNPLLPDTRSELAVPMIAGRNLIGVFDIQSDQVGRFTDSDVNIQTTLAAQIAVSIQNVRSFEQSKAQADLESLVNAIGQKIQRAATVEEVLQTAVREIGTALDTSSVRASIAGRQTGDNGTSQN